MYYICYSWGYFFIRCPVKVKERWELKQKEEEEEKKMRKENYSTLQFVAKCSPCYIYNLVVREVEYKEKEKEREKDYWKARLYTTVHVT